MSSKPRTAIRTVTDVRRHGTSVNGNPQYRVHFADGTSALTSSDAMIAYEIANPEYRDATVELTLTRAGRITFARHLPYDLTVTDADGSSAALGVEYDEISGVVRLHALDSDAALTVALTPANVKGLETLLSWAHKKLTGDYRTKR